MFYKISLPLIFFFLFSPVFSQEEDNFPEEVIHDTQENKNNQDIQNIQDTQDNKNDQDNQDIHVNQDIQNLQNDIQDPAPFDHPDGYAQGDPVYIINTFIFNIEGITRPYALINNGQLVIGEEIKGLNNLEKYIQDKTQLLINQRVLDRASIDYTIGTAREDGKFPVDLIINTRDTWNIVAIPRPRYSSNSGFDITLKARDYNFLGTMSPLRVDIGYIFDQDRNHFFQFMQDANMPFSIFGFNWNFKFTNYFDYRPAMEQPFFYKNISGLSVEFPLKFASITTGFEESFIVNDENSSNDKPLYGDFQDGFYMSSVPYVSLRVPTGIEAGVWGELVYSAGIFATFNHEFPKWPLDEPRIGPFLSLNHSFGFNRIDWIGNFLRGFDVSINNSFFFNFNNIKNNELPLSIYYNISGIGHFIITDFFGISAQLVYRQWIFSGNGHTSAGDILRGILDKDVCADYMLSLNLDFPFRVLRFAPSVWFDNSKLRIFNFDLHLVPIIDIALYHDPVNDTDFNFKNILAAGGFEAIIFPEFFRSLYLRISFAWNLSDFSNGKNYEIFIGTELHY